ncbi:flagellar protein [Alkalihalobacillus sp. LMS39]|uniref:flagellar protein n=1 Tax=Alkalihalobacillus sp. LMS39 TaxID=2924032 RepID=UPI001FB1FB53|nr:flagellar protein [Alkalihalobacillus sp. LMS39]UOE93799.1 flagellar protein [Alkalihalobacillus sp. LMS39]
MSTVKELYLTSKQLFDHLTSEMPEDEEKRDQFIQTVNEMIEKRDVVIANYSKSPDELTVEEKKLASEIVKVNAKIQELMQEKKEIIGLDISKLKQKQQQGKKYDNPYDGPTVDGVFFDKRGI